MKLDLQYSEKCKTWCAANDHQAPVLCADSVPEYFPHLPEFTNGQRATLSVSRDCKPGFTEIEYIIEDLENTRGYRREELEADEVKDASQQIMHIRSDRRTDFGHMMYSILERMFFETIYTDKTSGSLWVKLDSTS